MDDFVLGCKFINGAVKLYDMKPLIRDNSVFAYFEEHPDLFLQARLSSGGYAIIWNDELDLAEEEVWYNGWPEWDESNLVTVEFEIDSELLRQVTERLQPFGLTPEDWIVMSLEALVYPPTQEKATARLIKLRDEQAALESKEES